MCAFGPEGQTLSIRMQPVSTLDPLPSQFCMYQKKQISFKKPTQKTKKTIINYRKKENQHQDQQKTHTKQKENRIQNTISSNSNTTKKTNRKGNDRTAQKSRYCSQFRSFPTSYSLKNSVPLFCQLTKFIPIKNTFLEHSLKKNFLFLPIFDPK